jgi:GTP-binding protein
MRSAVAGMSQGPLMAFVDEAKVFAFGGDGGNGIVAWHHEPYKPKGGPDGGNGGAGGDVVLRADPSTGSLLEVRDHPHIRAERGGHGRGKRRQGPRGRDRIVLVPVGTVVFDEAGTLIADLATPGAELVAARGGAGGRGNTSFASSTRQAPAFAEKGEPGERRTLRLELRLVADVGLVGFPNAGKSTLVSRISAAKPKIADYPFTTLVPNLGVVRMEEDSFVVADIPGLVEGAGSGKGLGHRFLRHVNRAALLVFMVDPTAPDRDPDADFDVLRAELAAYDPELARRPHLVVMSKADADPGLLPELQRRIPGVIPISAVTGFNIDLLVGKMWEGVQAARAAAPPPQAYVRVVERAAPIAVRREDGAWRVTGAAPERAVARADLDNEESVERLQRRLLTLGVERELTRAGAVEGDEVRIGEASFDFVPEAGAGA